MLSSDIIKEYAISIGADKCGIASVDRFSEAPEGFNPIDVYQKCKSVIVFLKQMPTDVIMAQNPVPYSHTAFLLYNELDRIGLDLCRFVQKNGDNAVPVPTDTPYIYWDESRKHGMGIISLRHAAYFAGLGILGKNTLLINSDLGNMVYIGAILTDAVLEQDNIEIGFKCPDKCSICLDSCPHSALDGITVNQKICRLNSNYENGRGFDIYGCNVCRRQCIYRTGSKKYNSYV